MKHLLLLLLPTIVHASIFLNISGKVLFDEDPPYILGNVNYKGFIQRLITDDDKVAFNIVKDQADAIERIVGRRPSHITYNKESLRSSCPGNENICALYNNNKVKPVEVTIEARAPNLVELTNETVTLGEINRTNDASRRFAVFQNSVKLNDTFSAVWSNDKVSGEKVSVEMNFKVGNDEAAAINGDFSFGAPKSYTVSKDKRQRDRYMLQKGQTVTARLVAKKGVIKFEVPYQVFLSGHVIAQYDETYKTFPINELLNVTTIEIYQTVVYEFYYALKLQIVNPQDGKVLNTRGIRRRVDHKEAVDLVEKIMKKPPKGPLDLVANVYGNRTQM